MSDIRMARRPFSWSSIAAFVVEAVAACGFVIAVYELVVAGGIALFPNASDHWILVLWIAAAAISGAGMPAAAGPGEDALPRLAALLAEGTGARSAAVWLPGPSGLWRASSWPDGDGLDQPATAAGEAELRGLAGVDYVAPVRDADQLLGALTLRAREGHDLALPDVRLATDMANSAGLLLRNAELGQRLRERTRVEMAQAAELDASRLRVVVARDAAREQLSAEIQAQVCVPLERCAGQVTLLSPDEPGALVEGLATMSAEIDTAIADFRRIVHGVYPPVLTDHGLRAAMESLLTELDLQATLAPPRIPRLAARVEVGTYFCAAALLREWHGSGARHLMRVYVGVTGRQIEMTFVDGMAEVPQETGAEGAPARAAAPVSPLVLEAVQDRVAAMGGRMISGSDESNRWLAIEVPLATADLTPHAAPDGDTP